MMFSEFINGTGIEMDFDDFGTIQQLFLSTDLDKDEFCVWFKEISTKETGIEYKVMMDLAGKASMYSSDVYDLTHTNMRLEDDVEAYTNIANNLGTEIRNATKKALDDAAEIARLMERIEDLDRVIEDYQHATMDTDNMIAELTQGYEYRGKDIEALRRQISKLKEEVETLTCKLTEYKKAERRAEIQKQMDALQAELAGLEA